MSKKTYYIRKEDCKDIGWTYEIEGKTYDGNLVVMLDKTLVVKGNQIVEGNQRIEGNQIVEGYQRVKGNQRVQGDQTVEGDQRIEGNQIVKGNQIVEGYQDVQGNQRIEVNQIVKFKSITGHCKWIVYYSKNTIKIGCKEKTTKDWQDWFDGTEEYETPRDSFAFRQIYKAFCMAKVAQELDEGLMEKDDE